MQVNTNIKNIVYTSFNDNQNMKYCTKATDNVQAHQSGKNDYMEILRDKIKEMSVKIQSGNTEPSFRIGSQYFTLKEWDEFLQKFDSLEEAVLSEIKDEAKCAKAKEIEQSSAGEACEESVEDDVMNLLVSDTLICRFPDDNSQEEEQLYLIVVDGNGIRCMKANSTEYEWEIVFDNEAEYKMAAAFINGLPDLDTYLFASNKDFWQELLAGKIHMEDFYKFLNSTNNGIPDYAIYEGESVYIDKEKIKYAPYMNLLNNNNVLLNDEFIKQQETMRVKISENMSGGEYERKVERIYTGNGVGVLR